LWVSFPISSSPGFELVRYNSNGSIDTSFGHQGATITDFSSFASFTSPSDLVIETNGDILVAEQAAQPDISIFLSGSSAFALARYINTGQLDVGSEVARLRAGHRPPPKLHVRLSG
jgi:hypothetical protein